MPDEEIESSVVENHDTSFMQVYLRIRPFTEEEVEERLAESCIAVQNDTSLLVSVPENNEVGKRGTCGLRNSLYNFEFTKIFSPETSQRDFFRSSILNGVQAFVDGQDCLVLSYGLHNSGRTYTVQGDRSNPGLLPRVVDVVFNSIKENVKDKMSWTVEEFSSIKKSTSAREMFEKCVKGLSLEGTSKKADALNDVDSSVTTEDDSNSAPEGDLNNLFEKAFESLDCRIREEMRVNVVPTDVAYCVWVSFAEIKDENIYDLLEDNAEENRLRSPLYVAQDHKGNSYVDGLLRVSVSSADEALRVFLIGQRNLRMAAMKTNGFYGNSHYLFCLELARMGCTDEPEVGVVNRLLLCDVGGSENMEKLDDANEIQVTKLVDPSFLVLDRCLTFLRERKLIGAERKQMPFADSKLTQLLEPYFSYESGYVAMVVSVSPCSSAFEATLSTLKFSALKGEVITDYKLDSTNSFTAARTSLAIVSEEAHLSEIYAKPLEGSSCRSELSVNLEDLFLDRSEEEKKRNEHVYDHLSSIIHSLRTKLQILEKEKLVSERVMWNRARREFISRMVEIDKCSGKALDKQKALFADEWKHEVNCLLKNMQADAICDGDHHSVASGINIKENECSVKACDLSVENRLLNAEVKSLRENLQKLSRTFAQTQLEKSQLQLQLEADDMKPEPSKQQSALQISQLQARLLDTENIKALLKRKLVQWDVRTHILTEKIARLEKENHMRQNLLTNREDTIKQLKRKAKEERTLVELEMAKLTEASRSEKLCKEIQCGTSLISASKKDTSVEADLWTENSSDNSDVSCEDYGSWKKHAWKTNNRCEIEEPPDKRIKQHLLVRCERLNLLNGNITTIRLADLTKSQTRESKSSLPPGWCKRVNSRRAGRCIGKKDIYIINPDGRKFNCAKKLQEHLKATDSEYDISQFNFLPDA